MKKFVVLICLLVNMAAFSGCAYVDIRSPYDENLNKTELGSKVGVSNIYSLLWLFAWGDGSYAAAARNGNITVMRHADQQIENYLFGLFIKRSIIVYGD